MVNKPLIRPYFWGGYVRGGGRLTSHDMSITFFFLVIFEGLVWDGGGFY